MSKSKLVGIIGACNVAVIGVIIVANLYTSTYTLSITVNPSGAGSVLPADAQYQPGVEVTLTASPAIGYEFLNRSSDVGNVADVDAASTSIIMRDDYLITANFVVQYELTIRSTDSGQVTTPGEGVFARGQDRWLPW